MSERLRKIGQEKAHIFQKNFDTVYDFWKNKAENEHNYFGELKLKKEKGKVIIFILLKDLDDDTQIEPENWCDDTDFPDFEF
jgi:hypothetical protein